jgi:CxxC-x17-CxxC domain-containing protein
VSFQDRTLTCRDCGQSFTFTSGEQDFYASRGLTNDPSRCPDCRAIRRGQSGGGYGGGGGGRTREMFDVVCSNCGKDTQVPFQPTSGRPVYCSDCFAKQPRQSSYR